MATPNPTVRAKSFTPLRDYIFVTDLEGRVQKTKAGIIIPDDNMKAHGIKSRWCRVWRCGPNVTMVKPGEWILVEHGRWTNKISIELPEGTTDCWRVEPSAIQVVSDSAERPNNTVEHKF
jgi:co-chaperonin GroES (HSP10)